MGRRSRTPAPVDEELSAAAQDFVRRRKSLAGRSVAAGVSAGAAGAAGQDPAQAALRWLPQARDPQGLSPAEAAQLKAKILENMRLMVDSENDRKKPLHEIAKAQLNANNDLMKQLSSLIGKDLSATGNVIAARTNAIAKGRVAVETAITQAYDRSIEDPSTKLALKSLQGAATEIMADGAMSPADMVANPTYLRQLSSAMNATQQDPYARAAILSTVTAPFYAEGQTPAEAMQALDAAMQSASPDQVPALAQVQELFSSEAMAEAESVRTAAEERVIARDEEYRKTLASSIPVRYRPFLDALLEAQGADPNKRKDTLKRTLEEVDGLEAADPALRQKMEDALDALEQGSPNDLTISAAKAELQNSRKFREYMQETGIQDPNLALRQLNREIRRVNRAEKKTSRTAMEARNKAFREGGAPPPKPTEDPRAAEGQVVPRGLNAEVADLLQGDMEALEDQ